MATRFEYLTGKLKWVKVDQPDQYNKWSCTIYPISEDVEKIREWQAEGLKNNLKKDEDGWYASFHRKTSMERLGQVVGLSPPLLLDGSQKLPDGNYMPLTGVKVGNGSDGVIKLEVFPFKQYKGMGARLASIRIDNLIKFEPARDYNDNDKGLARGMDEQKEQLF